MLKMPDYVYIIVTEINGYKNIYGHIVYNKREDAERIAESARKIGNYDFVFVCQYNLF